MSPNLILQLPPILVPEESVHPHVPEEYAGTFRAIDGASTEVEYLQLLHTLIHMLKPKNVVETGTFHGWGTVALALALAEVGEGGQLTTLERDPEIAHRVTAMLGRKGLGNVKVVCADALAYFESLAQDSHKPTPFDFGFFDSDLFTRAEEFEMLHEHGLIHGTAAFHDTSRLRGASEMGQIPEMSNRHLNLCLDEYSMNHGIHSIEFPWSRGLRLFCNIELRG